MRLPLRPAALRPPKPSSEATAPAPTPSASPSPPSSPQHRHPPSTQPSPSPPSLSGCPQEAQVTLRTPPGAPLHSAAAGVPTAAAAGAASGFACGRRRRLSQGAAVRSPAGPVTDAQPDSAAADAADMSAVSATGNTLNASAATTTLAITRVPSAPSSSAGTPTGSTTLPLPRLRLRRNGFARAAASGGAASDASAPLPSGVALWPRMTLLRSPPAALAPPGAQAQARDQPQFQPQHQTQPRPQYPSEYEPQSQPHTRARPRRHLSPAVPASSSSPSQSWGIQSWGIQLEDVSESQGEDWGVAEQAEQAEQELRRSERDGSRPAAAAAARVGARDGRSHMSAAGDSSDDGDWKGTLHARREGQQQEGGGCSEQQDLYDEAEGEGDVFARLAWQLADETGACSVCLCSFAPNEVLRVLPLCGHVFHAACVDTWLQRNATCPNCRAMALPAWVVEAVVRVGQDRVPMAHRW